MGRGRAKAKQTKVARELKYHTPNTDLSALQAELAGSPGFIPTNDDDQIDGEEFADDPYAKYYDDAEEADENVEESDDDEATKD